MQLSSWNVSATAGRSANRKPMSNKTPASKASSNQFVARSEFILNLLIQNTVRIGDPEDFADRRDPFDHFRGTRLAQRQHPFLRGKRLDLARGGLRHRERTDRLRHLEQ